MTVSDGTFMEVDDDWPRWEWQNDMRQPTKVMVEPPFKSELGDVFLRMDMGDQHVGCWFTREQWDEMHQAGLRAAEHPTFEDTETEETR